MRAGQASLHWPWADLHKAVAVLGVHAHAEVLPTIDSTNSELIRRARSGDTRPCLLVAEQQTAGRGRQGRNWQGLRADALTFSLGLMLAPADWSGLSLAVGVCIADALDAKATMGMGLKWPNDIWVDAHHAPRKLAGILIETVWTEGDSGTARYTVMGIGINLHAPMDAGLSTPAAGLREWMGEALLPPHVLQSVIAPLVAGVQLFEAQGFAAFKERFAKRDVLQGQTIRLSNGIEGVACGVDIGGVLQVDTAQGRVAVNSDEVSVRLAVGAA
ncbi:MAG: biotin--[acetyl-CoA-carboxylase] ligase [Betaproteobacteria bacterium]|jgi:BirA family biotin operon repressor/biotin-[acetyl-CoA-carboxylase] ligase|nr:biotin--[acetyl-CoA-carboxylase] ligase [Betaproteobacteria bacterium]